MAETSDRVSAIAADLRNITSEDIKKAVEHPKDLLILVSRIRSVAASAQRQDQTKGLRGLMRRLAGK